MRHCTKSLVCAVASISLFGCHHRPPAPEAQRDYAIRAIARSALIGLNLDTLRVDITVFNTAKAERYVDISPCHENTFAIKVQRDRTIWESVAWERERMQPPVVSDSSGKVIQAAFICSAVVALRLLPGRPVLVHSSSTSVRDILGDSLPPGRYQIKASFWVNERRIKGMAAGEVELRRPPLRTANLDSLTVAGCYSLIDGPWKTDSLAKRFVSYWNIPSEIKLRSTRLPGWAPLQNDSLPLFAVETREKSASYSSVPFQFWQRLRPESESIYVGIPLVPAGVAMNLVRVGSDLRGKIFSFTDSPGTTELLASFPITLRRIDCW
jgi:hypothetical protein